MPTGMGILGRKIGMTQIFKEDGTRVPVTIVKAGPCTVVQVKTEAKDGYTALQIGFTDIKSERLSRPEDGHQKNAGLDNRFKNLREFRVESTEGFEPGTVIDTGLFEGAKKVHVTGTSKGRGFAGVVKRWNYVGGRKSHGSQLHRAPGSVGASAYPAKVWKGKALPGHYGDAQITVRNLKLERIDKEKSLLYIRGSVPGAPNSMVRITMTAGGKTGAS